MSPRSVERKVTMAAKRYGGRAGTKTSAAKKKLGTKGLPLVSETIKAEPAFPPPPPDPPRTRRAPRAAQSRRRLQPIRPPLRSRLGSLLAARRHLHRPQDQSPDHDRRVGRPLLSHRSLQPRHRRSRVRTTIPRLPHHHDPRPP